MIALTQVFTVAVEENDRRMSRGCWRRVSADQLVAIGGAHAHVMDAPLRVVS